MINQCPRGFICINNFNVLSIILVVLGSLYFINRENNRKLYDRINEIKNDNKNLKNDIEENKNNKQNTSNNLDYDIYDRDMKAIQDPLYPPLKRNFHIDSKYQLRHRHGVTHSHSIEHSNPNLGHIGIPINIETRGPSEDYQQVGMLYKEAVNNDDSKPGNNNDSSILPLFGKPLYRGSSNWLYYSTSDKLSSVKIPLSYENKDCTDDQGCRELNDGDSITVPSYNGIFKVKMYKFDKPRYIPYVY